MKTKMQQNDGKARGAEYQGYGGRGLLMSIEAALDAGGETIGIEDGEEPIGSAVKIAHRAMRTPQSEIEGRFAFFKTTRPHDPRMVGYIEYLADPRDLNSTCYPVRKAIVETPSEARCGECGVDLTKEDHRRNC